MPPHRPSPLDDTYGDELECRPTEKEKRQAFRKTERNMRLAFCFALLRGETRRADRLLAIIRRGRIQLHCCGLVDAEAGESNTCVWAPMA
jgi:hypothetical protein